MTMMVMWFVRTFDSSLEVSLELYMGKIARNVEFNRG